MAYQVFGSITVAWVGDGSGPMSVPSAQSMTVNNLPLGLGTATNGGPVQVPGGDAPSTANIVTACASLATALSTALNVNIAGIQGWASGSP